jgi:hypothetical protein
MQETNLKVSPYFDDFDRSKNYHRVLFKPGYSVQTRELNTLQSILQNQVERFGQHMFKDGSMVIPGNVGYNLQYNAVLVQNLINGLPVENIRESLVGKTITGLSSGVKAQVIDTLSQSESEKDTITLYVKYTSGGFFEDDVQLNKFKNNEILIDSENNAVAVTILQNSTEYTGCVAYVNPGVYFIRGFFTEVDYQRIILDQYSNTPSYKIGLNVLESVVSAVDDESLYDNSRGSTNYSGPGADRLKIETKLVKQNLLLTEDNNFVELLRLEEGNVVKLVEFSTYNEIEKNLARRTFDESGSYTLSSYDVKIRDVLFDGINDGIYFPNQITSDGTQVLNRNPTEDEPNSINGNDFYALEISEGKAYVKGFEVNNTKKQYVLVEKPRNTAQLNNQGIFLNIGSYLKLDRQGEIFGRVLINDKLLIKDSDNLVIGECTALGLTIGNSLYVSNLDIFTKLTLSTASHLLEIGDFIFSTNNESSAVVHSINGNEILIRQVSGRFIRTDAITSSRVNYQTKPNITDVEFYNLENARKVQKISGATVSFSASIKLDSALISGTSFNISGTSLTGINTKFLSELSNSSTLLIGNSIVEVSSVSNTTVTLDPSASITPGTYYNVSKLICKVFGSNNGLTTKVSSHPVKSSTDFSYNISVSQIYQLSQGSFLVSRPPNESIEGSSIICTSSTSFLNPSINQIDANNVQVSISGLPDGTSINVYYKVRISNATPKIKRKKTYEKLVVNLTKDANNIIYGTRLQDKEWSLKFPDVFKIHAIHEALNPSDANEKLFDTLVLNNSDGIVEGDVIVFENIISKVIDINSTTVKVKYLSENKFINGKNLSIPISIGTNANITGRFVIESSYGNYKDITSNYTLVKNDTENYYRVSKLVRKTNRPIPSNKVIVIFDYFEHDNLSNDFYTVDSYQDINYDEIPNSFNNVPYSDIIDFRYYVMPSTVGSGTLSNPHRETISSLNYVTNSIASSTKFAYPNSILSLDYDFYLGRIDKVYLNETGYASVIKGSDSINPKLPLDNNTGLLISIITLPPYFKKTSDANIKLENTKGYTMKDIGKLEERLSNVETYTSLNLLEVNTNNLNILDEDGRNRFKNGFIVDKFNTVSIADLANPDYTASIDTEEYLLRPYPYVNSISLNYDGSGSSTTKTGNIITLPYTQVPYIVQEYSSRVENLNPFEIVNWVGEITINPEKDVWYDTIRTVDESRTIDLESPIRFLFDNSGASGDQWGNWDTSGVGRTRGGTNIFQTRTGVNNRLDVKEQTIDTGDTINSVTDIRFVRSVVIDLQSASLKPNTNFNLSINTFPSNQYFYPKLITNLQGVNKRFVVGETVSITPIYDDRLSRPAVVEELLATVVNPYNYTPDNLVIGNNFVQNPNTGQFEYSPSTKLIAIDEIRSADGTIINPVQIGSKFRIRGLTSGSVGRCDSKPQILSNDVGELFGFILLPPNKYQTGILSFTLSDRSDSVVTEGFSLSSASTSYFAQGSEINVTSSIVSVSVPQISTTPISSNRTVFVPDPPPPPPRPTARTPLPPRPVQRDPIAQSFFIDTEGGIFATSIDLYFYTKDNKVPVTVDIRTVENGTPTETIVPYSSKTLKAKDVKISTDASVPTRFVFDSPVYLSSQTDYCFVVRSVSENYFIWVSRLGEVDATTRFIIDKQPYVGVLFKSANMSTWTPDQYEDIKFVLNRAQFTPNRSFSAILHNTKVPDMKLISDALTFTQNSSAIKIFQPNHGMHSTQNFVRLSNVISDVPNAILKTTINDSSTTIVLEDLSNNLFNFSSSETWSKINNQAISESNPGFIKIGDEVISYTQITSGNTFKILERGADRTVREQHESGSIVQCYNINGIKLGDINKVHRINRVISMDEYEILVPRKANSTTITGGDIITASRNIQYEILNPSINILNLPETNSSIILNSITGTSIGNNQQPSFLTSIDESIQNLSENELSSPRLVASDVNRSRLFGNKKGTMDLVVNMSTSSDTLSPVIDLQGSSIITISNRINRVIDIDGNLNLESELAPTGGLHSSYITKKVILENSSTSIRVLFDAIRRQGADIKVFAKTKDDSSIGRFNDMSYIELLPISEPISETEQEYRSFEYEILGLSEFKEWSIKIVMISNDQSNIPKIKNFRAIALAI